MVPRRSSKQGPTLEQDQHYRGRGLRWHRRISPGAVSTAIHCRNHTLGLSLSSLSCFKWAIAYGRRGFVMGQPLEARTICVVRFRGNDSVHTQL